MEVCALLLELNKRSSSAQIAVSEGGMTLFKGKSHIEFALRILSVEPTVFSIVQTYTADDRHVCLRQRS